MKIFLGPHSADALFKQMYRDGSRYLSYQNLNKKDLTFIYQYLGVDSFLMKHAETLLLYLEEGAVDSVKELQ